MSYAKAVLDEQSDYAMWTDPNPGLDMAWSFMWREEMYANFFSLPENEGKVCMTGRAHGYVL